MHAQIKLLLIDGQSLYHDNWPEVGALLKEIIGDSEAFEVTRLTTAPINSDISDLNPAFGEYDVVVSIYDGDPWPADTRRAFEAFVTRGGGFVSIHAADNAFPDWGAYNEMIGLGGWGSRESEAGPYVYYDSTGQRKVDTSPGRAGSHGDVHAFEIELREPHPVSEGLPVRWTHSPDELYDRLRGPALNMTVIATAYSDPKTGGTGRHEPVHMGIDYGKGRVLHTTLAHDTTAMRDKMFQKVLLRGCEWAATGKVDKTK